MTRASSQEKTTEHLLEEWGKWSSNTPDTGYPRAHRIMPTLDLTDDEALEVDRSVARLRHRDPELGEAVFLFYRGQCSYLRVAKEMGIDRRRASVLVQAGTAWIDSRLIALREAA